jgi:Zn-dependent peptidase ImmA (M78 family)/transcriptional regulator with XRE-family HTH domain
MPKRRDAENARMPEPMPIQPTLIGERIRQHRETVGMKILQLAGAIGVSRNTITHYESGKTLPKTTELVKISRTLGCQIEDLLGPAKETKPLRFAFRAHRILCENPSVAVTARRLVRAYREIEEILDAPLPARLEIREFNPEEIPPSAFIPAIAEEFRSTTRIGQHGAEWLPVILEALGVRVLFFRTEAAGLDGLSTLQQEFPLILLNQGATNIERVIFSAAHELGHLILHPHLFTEAPVENQTDRDYEKEANLFAGHFLVPSRMLLELWNSERLGRLPLLHALLILKPIFHVSLLCLFCRAKDEGLTHMEYGPFMADTKNFLGIHGKARKEDLEPEPLQEAILRDSDRFKRLVRSAFVQEKIGIAKVAELLQIPVEAAKETTAAWLRPGYALVG